MPRKPTEAAPTGWRHQLHETIFEADTLKGRIFDVALIWSIGLSVLAAVLESVASVRADYGEALYRVEWAFTILFTIEYVLRLAAVRSPPRYALSFFGVLDLLAILPTYLSLFVPGTQALLVVRVLRLLRIFRIFKLAAYLHEAEVLTTALRASRRKISVFLATVLLLVLIIGTLIYVVEGEEHGFTSIPVSVYWAIVTLTTVGYGDLAPKTPLGQTLASAVMILGYAIIAIPTGIVTVEISRASAHLVTTQACPDCGKQGHDFDATHCKYCGAGL
jgi:voltage-gated potassium channel